MHCITNRWPDPIENSDTYFHRGRCEITLHTLEYYDLAHLLSVRMIAGVVGKAVGEGGAVLMKQACCAVGAGGQMG